MRPFLLLLGAAAMLAAAPAALAQDAPEGRVVRERPLTADDQAALNKEFGDAVQAARASLPVFWGRLAENSGASPEDYQLQGDEVWAGQVSSRLHKAQRLMHRLFPICLQAGFHLNLPLNQPDRDHLNRISLKFVESQ